MRSSRSAQQQGQSQGQPQGQGQGQGKGQGKRARKGLPLSRILLATPLTLACIYLIYLAAAQYHTPKDVTVARGGELADAVRLKSSMVHNLRTRRGTGGEEEEEEEEEEGTEEQVDHRHPPPTVKSKPQHVAGVPVQPSQVSSSVQTKMEKGDSVVNTPPPHSVANEDRAESTGMQQVSIPEKEVVVETVQTKLSEEQARYKEGSGRGRDEVKTAQKEQGEKGEAAKLSKGGKDEKNEQGSSGGGDKGEKAAVALSGQGEKEEGPEYWRARNIGEKCKSMKAQLSEDGRELMDNYALLVVDLWDDHWCKEGKPTLEKLACRMKDFLPKLRECGVPIVFSPGPELMNRYSGHPARHLVKKAPDVAGLKESTKVKRTDWPAMPSKSFISDKDGGCSSSPDKPRQAWTRVHPSIEIKDDDFIAVDAKELQRILKWTGKKGFMYSGVHTNMCIAITRTYSLLRLADVGVDTAFILDMSDSLISKKTDTHIKNRKQLAELYGEYFKKTVGTTVVNSFDLIPGFDEKYTANDCLPY